MIIVTRLREALGYATFRSGEVKDAALNLLGALQADLTEINTYEPSTEVEAATKQLQEAMNAADSVSEEEDTGEEDEEV